MVVTVPPQLAPPGGDRECVEVAHITLQLMRLLGMLQA